MGEKSMKCSCAHNDEDTPAALQIDKVKKSCCENRTVELNNSNILQKINDDITKLVKSTTYFVNITSNETFLSRNNLFIQVNKPPPKFLTDIPVNNSSLLI